MAKKKIAVIGLKGLPAYGGAGRAGESVIERLKHKYDYTVYAIDSHTKHKTGPLNGYYQHVFKHLKNDKLSVFLYYIKSALHCLLFRKYDLIQINHVETGFIVPILRLRYKLVGTARGGSQTQDKWSSFDKKLFLFFEYLFLKGTSYIIAVGKPHIPRYQSIVNRKYNHIPNGINLDEPYDNEVPYQDYIFFAAARILSIKGCHDMLEALVKINYPGKVVIAGDMEQEPQHRELLLQLAGQLPDVEFIELIKEKKRLMAMLRNAKMFIFPSYTEAMSNMLLEAASMQVPVVCSDIAENQAVFNEEEVLFFNTGNSDDLAEKIQFALDNPEVMTEKSQSAFATLEKDYTWDKVAVQYEKVYDDLMNL